MTDAQAYYAMTNLQNNFAKQNIDMSPDWLRWVSAIMNTKIGEFQYDNYPAKDLTSEITEMALMYDSNLCYYNSPLVGFGLYKWMGNRRSTKYFKPETVNLLTLSGMSIDQNVPFSDVVEVRDTTMNIPPFITLCSWLQKIQTIERTLEMELLWARMPFVLTGPKEAVNQFRQLIKKAYNFEPFAIGEKGIVESMTQYDVKTPIDPSALFDLMSKYMDKTVEAIGIYSADKKAERLITAEVNAQNDYVDFVYNNMYNERKRAVREANEKWGYNIVLRETYVENQQDKLKEEKMRAEIMESTKAKYQKQVEAIKNEGKVEAAKVTGIEASKIEAKNGGEQNANKR